jgi:hypothetical protein
MKTITIYELIGLVKEDKEPKKIKYDGKIWLVDYALGDYTDNCQWLFEKYFKERSAKGFINDEVEIPEEEKKIPEKIKSNGKEFYCDNIDSWIDKEETSAYCEYLMNKYNDLIDYLKSKGE